MPLSAGEKLGVYEILSPLGAGGMGEVYRARDTKLGREVAIKVLPEEFTEHPQKLARFEREARLLAALNHPGIATLHGLEEAEGKPFLVMELVEGETLADRISRGPIPVGEALEISRQIAEALEAAHEKGVIHRDLKPANVKVDPEGHVKVLDFGLAKAFADEVPESELSQSPTLSRDATRAGVILGTAAYMSPEQAKGKAVDKRSDIFSFGAVLYELLAGKKAFGGEDVSDVLASIIKLDIDWKALPSDLDPRIHKLLLRCLKQDRKKRLRDVGDLRNEIEEILAEPTAPAAQQPMAGSAPFRARLKVAWGLSVLLAALVAGLAVWIMMRSEPPLRTITRFPVMLPAGHTFTNTGRQIVALSPDGSRLAYVADQQLYLREMGQLEAVPIRGTEMTPLSPFFSPDGQWVGFYAGGSLRKISVTGGAPVTLCEAVAPYGTSWGPDNTVLFGQPQGILRVSANGGAAEVVIPTDSEKNERGAGPQMLPDGKSILFALATSESWDEAQIVAESLETGERRILIEGGSDARYVPTGHLVYALGETLFAVPFDLSQLAVTGGSVPVVEGVSRGEPSGAAHASVSVSGSLVYVPNLAGANDRIVWVDRQGREEPLPLEPSAYNRLSLSPDKTKLALDLREEDNSDIWLYDFSLGTLSRFTFDLASDTDPVWSPDGSQIYFSSNRDGPRNVYSKLSDGSGDVVRLTESQSTQWPQVVTPDGSQLLIDQMGEQMDILKLALSESSQPEPFLRTAAVERLPQFSPDGRFVVHESTALGRREIFVRAFSEGGGPFQISIQGGRAPVWSPDGREIFYINNGALMAVQIETEPSFRVVGRQKLFEGPYADNSKSYDMSSDGDRFIMIKVGGTEDAASQPSLVVVENWFEELKRLVPTN